MIIVPKFMGLPFMNTTSDLKLCKFSLNFQFQCCLNSSELYQIFNRWFTSTKLSKLQVPRLILSDRTILNQLSLRLSITAGSTRETILWYSFFLASSDSFQILTAYTSSLSFAAIRLSIRDTFYDLSSDEACTWCLEFLLHFLSYPSLFQSFTSWIEFFSGPGPGTD